MATVLIDSYSETNQNTVRQLASDTFTGVAQTFIGIDGTLDSAKLYIKKSGTPTGNAAYKVYAVTGTYGVDSKPTGSALATSDVIDVTTLTTSLALVTLNFTGANRISLTAGTVYAVSVEYSGGTTPTAEIQTGIDNSSPTHGGEQSVLADGNWTVLSEDMIFYIYAVVPVLRMLKPNNLRPRIFRPGLAR